MKKYLIIFLIAVLFIFSGGVVTYRTTVNSLQSNYFRLVDYENAKSNYYLDSVYVMDGKLEPEFNDDTYNYKVYVPSDTKELKMSFRPQSKYCTGEIEGNENLTNGSVVKINTVDGTGATFTYTFTVVYSNSKVLMVIIIIFISLIVLGGITALVLYILQKKGYIHLNFKKKEEVENGNYVN